MVENKIAVDRNHAALKRILASLVAMAGWTATGNTFLRACGDAGSASTLPRHLYVAILRLRVDHALALGGFSHRRHDTPVVRQHVCSAAEIPRGRLLRPAEAATRRLVIVLARGISVTLPPLRPAKPKPGPVLLKDGKGTGIVDTGISLYRLGLANVAPPIAPSAPLGARVFLGCRFRLADENAPAARRVPDASRFERSGEDHFVNVGIAGEVDRVR